MEQKHKTKYYLYFVAIVVNIASFCCGTSFVWTSPVFPKMDEKDQNGNYHYGKPINEEEKSWIASLLMLGAALGPVLVGFLTNNYGRQRTITMSVLPILASYLMFALGNNVWYLYLGRFIAGMGIGILLAVIPMYVGEISQNWNRGTFSCFMACLITMGNLFVFCVGPYLTIFEFSLINSIFPICFLVLSVFLPESPYYYLEKGMDVEARRSLRMIRYEWDIDGEVEEINENIKASQNKLKFKEIISSKAVTNGLRITLGVIFFQQLTGINGILSYMQTIFPPNSVMIVGLVQVAACVVTSLEADKLGRKFLLLTSTIGSCLSLILMGIYFHFDNNNYDVSAIYWMPTFSLITFIITYNLGLGSLPFTLISEIFPINVKGYASGITICFGFILGFGVTKVFTLLASFISLAFNFWLCATFCAIGFAYVLFLVPETKGKSLQEIQLLLST